VLLTEYILFSLTLFGCLGAIFLCGSFEEKTWTQVRDNLTDFGFSAFAAMVCTVGLHLAQLKALTGSWRSGLNEFVFNAMKRVSVAQAEGFRGSSSENLLASLEFGVDDALLRILETPILGPTSLSWLAWISVGFVGLLTLTVSLVYRLGWRKCEASLAGSAAEAWFVAATGGWLVWVLLVPSWFTHLEFARGVTFFAWVLASFALLAIRLSELSLARQYRWEPTSLGLRLALQALLMVVVLALGIRRFML